MILNGSYPRTITRDIPLVITDYREISLQIYAKLVLKANLMEAMHAFWRLIRTGEATTSVSRGTPKKYRGSENDGDGSIGIWEQPETLETTVDKTDRGKQRFGLWTRMENGYRAY